VATDGDDHKLLTWKEFEQLPGEHLEILEGELITLLHRNQNTVLSPRTLFCCYSLFRRTGWAGLPRGGLQAFEDPASWIQPDVSFLKMERVRATKPDDCYIGAPELAVEVVSPSETAEMLSGKINLLLAGGSLAVWAIYSRSREVRVFLPDGTSFKRGVNDVLTAPELLPGWELPVAKLFESDP